MSTYNIREKFSYVISSSNIEYIRNYNFNSSTITDIPLFMANSDDVIPITVNITTTRPWVAIVDPTTGANLKYPAGNVVLEPSSSKVVLVKIDLPPDIESIAETVERPNISLDIKSGSFPIVLVTQTTGSASGSGTPNTTQSIDDRKNSIVTAQQEYILSVGEKIKVDLTVYDKNGDPDTKSAVLWRVIGSKEPTKDIEKINATGNVATSRARKVVKINSPIDSKSKKRISYPRTVEGVAPGTAYVLLTAVKDVNASLPRSLDVNYDNNTFTPTKDIGKRTLIKFTVINSLPNEDESITVSGSRTTTITTAAGSVTPPIPPINDEIDAEDNTL